jgi:phosphatidylglycerophosphate synthase
VKFSQIFTAPNQLTLLRMIFVPFIVIHLVEGRYLWALADVMAAAFTSKRCSANTSIPSPTSFC